MYLGNDNNYCRYEYGLDANKELWNLSLHDKALRDMKFSDRGDRKWFFVTQLRSAKFLDTDLYTVSSDRALKVTDVETSKTFLELEKAHKYVYLKVINLIALEQLLTSK